MSAFHTPTATRQAEQAAFTPVKRRIYFERLALQAHIGILEHERQGSQPIYIDAQFDMLVHQPSDDNDISSVLDYRLLRQHMIQVCTTRHVNLLETLIEELCASIFARFPSIVWLKIRIGKPEAFADCAVVGIEVEGHRPD